MKAAPVPTILDLWSLGHSASQVASMLAVEGGHKAVTKIVAQAREIGDPRAVYHERGGQVLGKGEHVRRARADGMPWVRRKRKGLPKVNGFEIVPALPKPFCSRGHARTPDNLTVGDACRICDRARLKVKR